MEGLSRQCQVILPDKPKQDHSLLRHRGNSSQGPCSNYFSNSSQCWGTSNRRIDPIHLDFKSSITEKLPWSNPCWTQEEQRPGGLHTIESIEDVDFVAEKLKVRVKRTGIHRKTQQYEEERTFKANAQHNDAGEALVLVDLLKIHTKLKDLCKGSKIHADIVQKGLLDKNVFVGCALLNMYAKCGALEKAQEVFDELPIRNIATWNALITGYTQNGHCEDALSCYEHMHLESFSPNAVTFACILSACSSIQATHKGQDIHACIIKAGLLKDDTVLANALIDMYAKCGSLAKAQEVLDELCFRDVISYTALIVGYAQHGRAQEAFDCFERMQYEGLDPNEVTFAGVLKACGSTRARDKGQEIHSHIIVAGLLEKDILVGTTVLDMYANCGSLVEAQDVFDELLVHDVVSWNALIAGYAQYELGEKALDCFIQMQAEGLSPNKITLACILKACGDIGALDVGQGIHAQIVKVGLLDKDLVCTGLVDMYANCGMLTEAKEVFDKLPFRNVVSWSALMVGFAQLGMDKEVFSLFESMIEEGTKPDLVIVTIVLNTCSHKGLVDKGQFYFETFSKGYDIFPTLEHHTCLVDLFGRAGHFDKAVTMIKEMPFSVNLTLWHTLLGACRKWENVKLGTWAFEQAVRLNQKDAEAYACMRNIYA